MRPIRVAEYYGLGAVPGFIARMSGSGHSHVPELTGLRGIAMLIVVIGHLLQRVERFYGRDALTQIEAFMLGILATPFSGCRLLFCITGYTLAIHVNRGRYGSSDLVDTYFLKNRFIRLCPPYFVVLISTYIFIRTTGYEPANAYQFHAEPESLTISLVVSLLYLHDLIFNTFPRLFPPGWYLEAHMQFLVIGPILFKTYRQIKSNQMRIIAGSAAFLASIVISVIVMEYGRRGIQYSVIAFLPYFLVGALLAEFGRHDNYRNSVHALERRLPLGALGLGALVVLGAPWGAAWWQLPAQLLAIAAIMSACLVGQSRFRQAMIGRNLTRIGIASFSIYLVHLQIFQIAVPVIVERYDDYSFLVVSLISCGIGLPLALGFSLVFFWMVERPCVSFVLHMRGQPSANQRLA